MSGMYSSSATRGFTVWLTGLSASGKSTISDTLKDLLVSRTQISLYVIDGDYMRVTINRDLGYARAERNIASERIAFVAKILNDNGINCIVNNISQDNGIRARVREIIGRFHLVFVDTPLEVCMKRDYKGHYAKALNGEIRHMVGIDEAFERPDSADVIIDTLSMTPDEAAEHILTHLVTHREITLH